MRCNFSHRRAGGFDQFEDLGFLAGFAGGFGAEVVEFGTADFGVLGYLKLGDGWQV